MSLLRFAPILGILFLLACPFTKVEESFNLHSIYDFIHHSSIWDHELYPGPVHRSFVGNLFIGVTSYIPCQLVTLVYSGVYSGLIQQVIVRLILYLVNIFVLTIFSTRLLHFKDKFLLITLTQFHLPFYMSRTLANTLALPIMMLGLTDWISSLYNEKFTRNAIRLVIFTAVVLRAEAIIVLIGILVLERIQGRSILNLIPIMIYDSLLSLFITASIDSYYWGRVTWPEMAGFVYNIVFNKSAEWGVSPIYQYIIDIAKICNISLVFIPFAFKQQISYKISFLICFVVGSMSLLQHKEWRFIIYIIPLINVLSAIGMHQIKKNVGNFVYLIIFIQIFISCSFCHISSYNYPGGYASISFASNRVIMNPFELWKAIVNDFIYPSPPNKYSIWMDFYAKQTGATLFVYSDYQKTALAEADNPFYLSLHLKALNTSRIDSNDIPIQSDYYLTTASRSVSPIWCIKGFQSLHYECSNFICLESKICLSKTQSK